MVRFIAILSLVLAILAAVHVLLIFKGNTYFYNVLNLTILKGELGPYLNDYVEFENDTLYAQTPKNWEIGNQIEAPDYLTKAHEKFKTTAYVVVKQNKIIHEQYFDGFSESKPSNSFSMAKSFVSALIGVALQKGQIQSIDQKVNEFLKEYKNLPQGEVTIKQLLMMSSGIGFDEDYLNPFAFPAKAYYGKNLKELLIEYPQVEEPGVYYDYQGGATQLLAFIVEAASGITLSKYFQDEVWNKIGAGTDGYWILDHKDGNEKASCCIIATARDFAKFGKLYLDGGKVDSSQIIPKWYLKESTSPNNLLDKRDNEKVHFYGYQWWMGEHQNKAFFYARGILGQYIFVVPEEELIIVRLGHKRSKERTRKHPNDIFTWLDAGLAIGSK